VDQSFAGTVRSIQIQTGYTSTLKLTRSLTIAGTGPASSQADGTLNGNGNTLIVSAGTFTQSGGLMTSATLSILSGATLNENVDNSTGNLTLNNSGTANLKNAWFTTVTNSGTLALSGGGGEISTLTNTGTLNQVSDLNVVQNFVNQGTVSLLGGTLQFSQSAKQTTAGASIVFNGGSMSTLAVAGAFQLMAGNLFGSASGSKIGGDVSNTGGTIYVGGTTGTLETTGNYTQGSGGSLNIGVDVNKGTNGMLKVDGWTVSLAGSLFINWTDGTPTPGSTWNVASFPSGTGGTDFTAFNGIGGPRPSHVAGTWNPYTVKV